LPGGLGLNKFCTQNSFTGSKVAKGSWMLC
jgi:hypothetical protein